MREILFKGKRVDNGEWVEGDYITIYDEKKHKAIQTAGIETPKQIYDVDPETVCQYTGLIDKNGKKIFEGDIIRKLVPIYKIGQKKPVGKRWMVGAVIWDATEKQYPGGWFISARDEHGNDEKYFFTCEFEIIGNIFDNPKLLTED